MRLHILRGKMFLLLSLEMTKYTFEEARHLKDGFTWGVRANSISACQNVCSHVVKYSLLKIVRLVNHSSENLLPHLPHLTQSPTVITLCQRMGFFTGPSNESAMREEEAMAKTLQQQFQGWSSRVERTLRGRRSPAAALRGNPVTAVVVAFLALISVAQLLRVLFHVSVVANGVVIPIWASGVACIVTALLAWLLWRENMR